MSNHAQLRQNAFRETRNKQEEIKEKKRGEEDGQFLLRAFGDTTVQCEKLDPTDHLLMIHDRMCLCVFFFTAICSDGAYVAR